jgi:hypothetical protein
MKSQKPPAYLDPVLPFEERVDDLIGRMSLPEKVSQMLNECQAIPRLGMPAYNYWSEGLHGVVGNGRATVFPQAIALAATWDTPLMYRVATAISDEGPRQVPRRPAASGLHHSAPGINFLVAQYQHLPGPALGARPGDLWRRPIPDR